jgi:tetratricopeptide (TPR) repeat protein
MTCFLMGQAYHALGAYPHAIDFLGQNVTALGSELLRERFDMPGLASVLCRAWLVWCLAEQGRFSEGLAYGEETVRIAEHADHPYSLIVACFGLGVVHLQKGEPQRAIAVLERGLTLSQTEKLPQLFPLVAAPLGEAYALAGRVAEAVPLLEEAVERAVAMQFVGTQARRLAWLGEAYLLAGRLETAFDLTARP